MVVQLKSAYDPKNKCCLTISFLRRKIVMDYPQEGDKTAAGQYTARPCAESR